MLISDEVACPDCRITLTPVTTLGASEDAVALRRDSHVAVDPVRRLIYVGQTYLPGAIAVYDWEGNLLSTFGRAGDGPGEFGTSPFGFHLQTDDGGRLHVLERGRWTVLRPGLDGLVGTTALRAAFDGVAVLHDGQLAATPTVLRVARDSHRFVVLDSTGQEIRRFAAMPEDPSTPIVPVPARGAGFWAPYLYEYRIERYDSNGSLRQVVRRRSNWFAPYGFDEAGPPFSRPTFGRVHEDEQGRLWTAVRVPAADRARADALLDEPLRLGELDRDLVQDTRIEVLDPENGLLLASERFPQALVLLDNGFVVSRTQSPEGLIQAVISSVSLVEAEGGR